MHAKSTMRSCHRNNVKPTFQFYLQSQHPENVEPTMRHSENMDTPIQYANVILFGQILFSYWPVRASFEF